MVGAHEMSVRACLQPRLRLLLPLMVVVGVVVVASAAAATITRVCAGSRSPTYDLLLDSFFSHVRDSSAPDEAVTCWCVSV